MPDLIALNYRIRLVPDLAQFTFDGRVDIRLDDAGVPRVLEVNCNPCLEAGVGLARSARTAGIDFPQLLQLILNAALEGHPFDMNVPMV